MKGHHVDHAADHVDPVIAGRGIVEVAHESVVDPVVDPDPVVADLARKDGVATNGLDRGKSDVVTLPAEAEIMNRLPRAAPNRDHRGSARDHASAKPNERNHARRPANHHHADLHDLDLVRRIC